MLSCAPSAHRKIVVRSLRQPVASVSVGDDAWSMTKTAVSPSWTTTLSATPCASAIVSRKTPDASGPKLTVVACAAGAVVPGPPRRARPPPSCEDHCRADASELPRC